jgi:hypothetical protein
MNALSVNILSQYVHNQSALLDFLKRAKPAAVLVMDSPGLAQAARAQNPQALVIHRAFNANDAQWENATTPQEWLNANVPIAANGVSLQLYNEPAPGNLEAFFSFLETTCALCPSSVSLAFPNFAVGNPHEADILNGRYDRILRLVCGTRHYLALHEYFKDSPVNEFPYLCGRFTFWLQRADVLGLPHPKIVITEHGRDLGGGLNDGWKGTGWTEQQYFDRLADCQFDFYAKHNVPVCIFCWGTGAGNRWQSFDVQEAQTLQSLIVQFGEEHPMTPIPPAPTYPAGTNPAPKIVNAPAGLKLRAQPTSSAASIRTMPYQEAITVYAQPVETADSYNWQRVTDVLGNNGWSANFVGGAPAWVDPPTTPPTGGSQWTQAQVDELTDIAAQADDIAHRIAHLLAGVELPGGGGF